MKKLVREIIGLALLLDEVIEEDVFVRYSGHVKSLNVHIREANEERSLIYDKSFYFSSDWERNHKSIALEMKADLQKMIEDATEIKAG